MQQDQRKKNLKEVEFFTEYGDSNRYKILEVIGKGSYGVVCAAIDTHTGEKVAIKKITNTFEHLSDAIRILREVKLLRLLRHPDIVEIKRIMLPPSKRDFKDIYVVFELMESDLHQVIKANDDLTHDHHRFFLYQMLRALKYMHTANVYHRDLKPKNILANANCKLKICDLGLARVAFNDTPSTIIWTDYVATRWYRAPELCGSFFSKYTPAIDIWSIGCIFAEVLTGKPLFPGKSVVHQLDLITDLLGTPSADSIAGVRNEKARRYLSNMRKKQPVPFSQKFPNSDPSALPILKRLLAFDPKDRPTAEEALADPYFKGLSKLEREPSCQPISKLEFEFERRGVTKEDVRQLLFREILEYHPQLLKDHIAGNEGPNFLYPSAVGQFRRQFAYLEENGAKNGPVVPPERKHVSLPRSTVNSSAITTHPNLAASFGRSRQVTEENGDSNKATDSSKQSRWLPAGMPEKVMGPMLLGDKARSMNDGRNGSFAPHGMTSHYVPNTIPTNHIRPVREFGSDAILGRKQQPAEHTIINMAAVVGPHTAIDIRSNPYYSPQVKAAGKLNDQIALNARLLQEQAQLGAIGATAVAVSAQRKVRTV